MQAANSIAFEFKKRIFSTKLRLAVQYIPRGVDPYATGGTCPPNIYEGWTSMVMSPQYFRSDVV